MKRMGDLLGRIEERDPLPGAPIVVRFLTPDSYNPYQTIHRASEMCTNLQPEKY